MHKEVNTVKCAFMYDIYGIVKVEKSNNIKRLIVVYVSHILL